MVLEVEVMAGEMASIKEGQMVEVMVDLMALVMVEGIVDQMDLVMEGQMVEVMVDLLALIKEG
jgi:multidrug resistance efflux pump